MQLAGAKTHAEFMTDETREHNTVGARLFYFEIKSNEIKKKS